MLILIAEDDEMLAGPLANGLVRDGSAPTSSCWTWGPPDVDGFDVCRPCRQPPPISQ